MSGGGANRVFTSTIQLQKAMVGWYTNQGVSDLKYGPIENWDVSRVTSFASVVGGENPFYDFSGPLIKQPTLNLIEILVVGM